MREADQIRSLDVGTIEACPYQPRRRFDEASLGLLAGNIRENGLIHPVLCRPVNEHYQLVCGERRLRAIRDYMRGETILAIVRELTDSQARIACLSENLQRDDLSEVERIEGIAEWVDARMCEDAEYIPWLKNAYENRNGGPRLSLDLSRSINRTAYFLALCDSDQRNGTQKVTNKVVRNLEAAFTDLNRPVDWQSFLKHDLPIIRNMPEVVKMAAIEYKLNKSQAEALSQLYNADRYKAKQLIETGTATVLNERLEFEQVALEDLSQREIRKMAGPDLTLRKRESRHAPPLPDGKFAVIYADPPWKYGDKLIEGYGAAEHHYPPMSIDELCAMGVEHIAASNAVLFLWVTSPFLQECFQVIRSWGFEYKAMFVWDKVRHNYGHYNSVRHELLLICTRGSYVPQDKTLHDSVVVVERSDIHSQKPERFRELIDQMYPSRADDRKDRIELFARRAGIPDAVLKYWELWGNEALTHR